VFPEDLRRINLCPENPNDFRLTLYSCLRSYQMRMLTDRKIKDSEHSREDVIQADEI